MRYDSQVTWAYVVYRTFYPISRLCGVLHWGAGKCARACAEEAGQAHIVGWAHRHCHTWPLNVKLLSHPPFLFQQSQLCIWQIIFVPNKQEDGISQTSYIFMGFWRVWKECEAWIDIIYDKCPINTSYLFPEIECNPSVPECSKCSISIVFPKEVFRELFTTEHLMDSWKIDIPSKYWLSTANLQTPVVCYCLK